MFFNRIFMKKKKMGTLKAFREKGLKMGNILSILYCELDEIRK